MSYAVAKKRYEDRGEEQQDHPPLPCAWCRRLTLRTMLAQYGARCLQCYDAYITASNPQPEWMRPIPANVRMVAPKAWAGVLQKREESGERLSKAQRDMWREVRP